MGIVEKGNSQLENLSTVLSILPNAARTDAAKASGKADHTALKLDDVPGLLVSQTGQISLETVGGGTESYLVRAEVVGQLFRDRFDQSLTAAELQLLIYLVSGKSLNQISEILQKAYNTHRNQLAIIRDKSGVSRQADLIQTMSVLVSNHVLSHQQIDPVASNPLIEILSHHFASGFRLHAPLMSSGRRLLVLDVGPASGQRCVFFHASFYPVFPLPHQAEILEQQNIRVVCPIRPGYFLAPTQSNDPEVNLDAYSRDVAEFIEIFGLSEAPFLSHTFGVTSLLRVANLLETVPPRMVISSPVVFNEDLPGSPGSFRKSWARMSYKFPNLLEPALRTFSRHFISPKLFISALETAYSDSPLDLELIRFSSEQDWYKALLKQTALSNALGVELDLKQIGTPWIDDLLNLKNARKNAKFIFSQTNPFSDYTQLKADLENSDVDYTVLENTGQNSPLYDADLLLRSVLGTNLR